jgi:hypothetical protein
MQDIETSILQQIVYKKSESELPNSRLSRIKNTTAEQIKTNTITIICLLLSGLGIFGTAKVLSLFLPGYDSNNRIYRIITYFLRYASLILAVNPCYKFIRYLCEKLHGIDIKKISVKAAEVELNSSFHNSVLNRRIDEILYFFERTDYDVVVFEDLDRFNNPEIFTHLRELNLLVNGYEKIKTNERFRICFIYALRDEMFANTDRVKFFDFIIPVIPVINTSNSSNILLRKKDKYPVFFSNIDNNFLSDIGLFINDMRLLKNVINEYVIYVQKVSNREQKKLFSMVLFKNEYPAEFAKIQYGKGLIVDIFSSINEIVKELDNKIDADNTRIEIAQNETLTSIKDPRILYIVEYFKSKGISFELNSIDTFCTNSTFEDIEKRGVITYQFNNYGNTRTRQESLDFFNIQSLLGHKYSYQERKEYLESEQSEYSANIVRDIDKLKKEKEIIERMSLQQLFEKYNFIVMNYYKSKNIRINDLLIYLLSRGYIDENYVEYISYFYEGFLTKKDSDYIISIRTRQPKEYDYYLTNCENVLKQIHKDEWANNFAILNISLLHYLLLNQRKYEKQTESFMRLISNEPDLLFLKKVIEKPMVSFINTIFKYCPEIWDDYKVLENKTIVEKKALLFIDSIPFDSIHNICNSNSFVDYLNKSENVFAEFSNYDIHTIFPKLIELNIKFKNLSEEIPVIALDNIIESCLFEISIHNIQIICHHLLKVDNPVQITNCLFIIRDKCSNNVISYIENNILKYIQFCLLQQNEITETEDDLKEILNKKELSDDDKKVILEKNTTVISTLSLISDKSLWSLLFSKKTIEPSWGNLAEYYKLKENSITSELVDYINTKPISEKLALKDIPDEYNKTIQNLYESLYKSDSISLEVIKILEEKNKWRFNDYDYNTMLKEKILFLIQSDSIKFNNEEFQSLKNLDRIYSDAFFKKNISTYLEDTTDISIDIEDIEAAICKENLDINIKEALFKKEIRKIFSSSDNLSIGIINFIGKQKMGSILDNNNIDFLIQSKNATDDQKINIVMEFEKSRDSNELIQYLGQINQEFENLNRKYILLKKNDTNARLFTELKIRRIASSLKEDKGQYKMYLCKNCHRNYL